jgi:NAD(P)-dependent dehydrogenase (short-subunit alcohol dehydrogenase family)
VEHPTPTGPQHPACKGRVALVTGASRGIGKALATRLAAEGADVAVVARSLDAVRRGTSLSDTVASISGQGTEALAIEADLGDPEFDAAALVQQVEDRLGPVDILVNNAGTGHFKPFVDWTPDEMHTAQQINVWTPWELSRGCVPGMRARGTGWILNISSAVATVPNTATGFVGAGGSLYGGTKAMLNRVTASLAAELDGSGVRANTLAPQSATATEGVLINIERGFIREEDTEPLETMVEAALELVSGELTGRIAYSLGLLDELKRPVRDLRGEALVDGWQPDDVARYFATGRFPHR